MKVFIDANTLVSQHFLKAHLGAALIFALRKSGAKIVLPESTRIEATHHALRLAAERSESIRKAFNQLQVLYGSQPNIDLPNAESIAKSIESHLSAIADIVEEGSLDVALVRKALIRIIDKRPPAHSKEEFRDSLFWEAAMEAAMHDEVRIVSADTDFTVKVKDKMELHPVLKSEASSMAHPVSLFEDIGGLLGSLEPKVLTADGSAVAQSVGLALRVTIQEQLDSAGLVLQEQMPADAKVFATQDPNSLAVSFDISFNASTTSGLGLAPEHATVTATGSGSLDARTSDVSDLQLDNLAVARPDGTKSSYIYLRGIGGSPPTSRPYEFRHPLTR